jgi:hypothetical protein
LIQCIAAKTRAPDATSDEGEKSGLSLIGEEVTSHHILKKQFDSSLVAAAEVFGLQGGACDQTSIQPLKSLSNETSCLFELRL